MLTRKRRKAKPETPAKSAIKSPAKRKIENPAELLAFLHAQLAEFADDLMKDCETELAKGNSRAAARCLQAHRDVRGFVDFIAAHPAK